MAKTETRKESASMLKMSADDEDENVMKLVFTMKFQLKSSDSAW